MAVIPGNHLVIRARLRTLHVLARTPPSCAFDRNTDVKKANLVVSDQSVMSNVNRREFIATTGVAVGGVAATTVLTMEIAEAKALPAGQMEVTLVVNGQPRHVSVEPRTTLLDALRNQAGLTGTKKGCDRGECGACTVHIEGRRILSCQTLAVMQNGKKITTIEGLESNGKLHPVQAAFIEHDGFQCGYCTSGQIMSGVAVIHEAKLGWPSAATADVAAAFKPSDLSRPEIQERMSGNLCRCACYPNIVDAVSAAAKRSA
jgi:xanthine dehydrogenase YagT iron-sulfur-binding subunit